MRHEHRATFKYHGPNGGAMAQFAIHGNWRSISALAAFFVFLGALAYAVAGGLSHLPLNPEGVRTRVWFGLGLYLLSFLVIGLGFWSKEDHIAVAGITGFSLLMILDIILRVGVLSFNLI